ncbi:MAG: 4Fe-4S dicluster domain-containing protein [Lachnospiraceae bacterium]|jgi:2-oxoglutarate ferredoxin oxidoreductase subunit delta|nr:4Fe-4S dicluster domain-containing protein [Lachnospiraceae bacterium]
MAQKKLILNAAWCKGCGICEAFCPKQVLKLEGEKITIAKPEDCIFCGQCEQRCPDYALYIEEEIEEVNQWVKPY